MGLAAREQTFWQGLAMADQRQTMILVVDEEPQILQLVRVILSREGWRVLCARSIREAARLRRRSPASIALALVDALTAEAHGPDWLERLRAEAEDMNIVIMSDVAPQGESAGLGFLSKPFTPDLLCNTVRRALGRNAQAAGR